MADPLIAIVGDVSSGRQFEPAMKNPVKAKKAAQELGTELARRGARLLVYGGPFLEADVVQGFVAGKPAKDHSILMWYSKDNEPPPFVEETNHPNLFERRSERGADWEIAFYRSIARADGVILIGGGNATIISGQVAVGTRMPILALAEFGGAAAKVWETLSAGEDLPNRSEINLMAQPWADGAAAACVNALYAQRERRHSLDGHRRPSFRFSRGFFFWRRLPLYPGCGGKTPLRCGCCSSHHFWRGEQVPRSGQWWIDYAGRKEWHQPYWRPWYSGWWPEASRAFCS
jgi:hypothetical protein